MQYRGYDISPETVTRIDGTEERIGFIGVPAFLNPVEFETDGSVERFCFDAVVAEGRKEPVDALKKRTRRLIDDQHESFEEQSGCKLDPRTLDKG